MVSVSDAEDGTQTTAETTPVSDTEELTLVEAVREGLWTELARDVAVLLLVDCSLNTYFIKALVPSQPPERIHRGTPSPAGHAYLEGT